MQLTITTEHAGLIGDIVAWLMPETRPYTLTVDNDQSMFDAHASSETGRQSQVVSTIIDYERQQRDQAWSRYEARMERERRMEYEYDDIVFTTACPFCQAIAGDACISAHDNPLRRPKVHSLRRVEAMNQVNAKLDAPASPTPTEKLYLTCKCGHDNVVHSDDQGCIIDACTCEGFDQLDAEWVGKSITLDEM